MRLWYLILFNGWFFIFFQPTKLHSEDLHWQNLPALSRAEVVKDDKMNLYLSRYGLDTVGSDPVIGSFKSDSFVCVGQIYRPEGPTRGTVIFLHGLFDHVGTNLNAITVCLKANYTFAAFDLPGHGLSSGQRGSIGDFNQYAKSLDLFLETCDSFLSPPFVFIGHSTGCAVALEYIISSSDQPFCKMIFLAPLVRSSSYQFSALGFKIFKVFRIAPRRWTRNSSHDKEVLKRFRNDSLQPVIFPLQWADAYFRWFERVKDMPPRQLPLTVIQGTGDNVVDWKYNLQWLENKIAGLKVVMIGDARHNLLNESLEYRHQCYDAIQKILNENNLQN